MQDHRETKRLYAGRIMTNGDNIENKAVKASASDNVHYDNRPMMHPQAAIDLDAALAELFPADMVHAYVEVAKHSAQLPAEQSSINPHAQPTNPSQSNQDAPQAISCEDAEC